MAVLDQALLDQPDGDGAHLVRIRRPAGARTDEVELGFLAVPVGDHPYDHMVGCVAPPDWLAVGVATGGDARHSAPGGPPPARAGLVVVASRSGALASSVRLGDDEPLIHAGRADATVEGRLVDGCLRVLGQPTPDPPGGTAEYWARWWLDSIMVEATARPAAPLPWPEVAGHHPLAPRSATPTVDELVVLGDDTAPHLSWSTLRSLHARGRVAVDGIMAHEAGWMDDGMFARELLAPYPDPGEVLCDLADLVTADALEGVRGALAAWGVGP
ncbi:hypothetical protein BH24ACT3_BH24ACT3_12810 [soil metagenome]